MRYQMAILFTATLLVSCLTTTHAQQATNASGGEGNGTGGTVSYSVGQLIYSSISGTNGSVSEGVQQAYEISEVSGLEESIGINLDLSAYPNTATDVLILSVKSANDNVLSYRLYDVNGRLLESQKMTGDKVHISMNHLSASTYLLEVLDNQRSIKTFKIIKN